MTTLLLILLIVVAAVVIGKVGERNGWSGCSQWVLLILVAIFLGLVL